MTFINSEREKGNEEEENLEKKLIELRQFRNVWNVFYVRQI